MKSGQEKKSRLRMLGPDNPMKNPEIVARVKAANVANGRYKKFGEQIKAMHAAGKVPRRKHFSKEEREAISLRMKLNNPMKRPEIAAKVSKQFTPLHRKEMSETMKKSWREGKITPRQHGMGKNKSEERLSPVLEDIGFRYCGDGTHWIAVTKSGIRRNPDFVWKSATLKTAFLLNGAYFHRDKILLEQELEDYRSAGWRVLIFWITNHVAKWHLPIVSQAATNFVNGRESVLSPQGQIQQFTILSATRTITSWPLES